jgi:hypothetical protein
MCFPNEFILLFLIGENISEPEEEQQNDLIGKNISEPKEEQQNDLIGEKHQRALGRTAK